MIKHQSQRVSAFTLVELIVVITILAILGTIGFLSLQGYSLSARDSARVSDLANISKAMDAQLAAWKLLPQPSSPMVTLTASGTVIGYQGCAGSGVLSIVWMSEVHDPLNGICYTYQTNAAQNRYQVLSLQEGSNSVTASLPLVNTAYAGPYDTRFPSTRGNQLGIVLGTWANLNQPIQEMSFTGLDLAKTTTASWYVMVFSNSDTTASVPTSGTGAYTGSLFTFTYNKRADLVGDKAFASLDSSLVGYWDMETTTGALLKDLSGYGNNGTCYSWVTSGACGSSVGPQFVSGNGKTGKSMLFTLSNGTYVRVPNSASLSMNGSMTMFVLGKLNDKCRTYMSPYYCTFLDKTRWVSASDNNGYILRYQNYNNSNTYEAQLLSNGGYLAIKYWQDANFSAYQALVGVYDADKKTISLYLNGVKIGNTTFNGSTVNTTALWIGGTWQDGGWALDGYIDEIRIYNRALSESEIQTLYNSTKQ